MPHVTGGVCDSSSACGDQSGAIDEANSDSRRAGHMNELALQSRTGYVVASVRARILARRMKPGSKITVRLICEEMGLSPTPVKEALAILERQGLVTHAAGRGYFVAVIDADDLLDIYDLREVLDAVSGRIVAMMADTDRLIETLNDLIEKQRVCVTAGDTDAYSELDLAFHQAILESSGRTRLIEVGNDLLAQLRLGRVLSTGVPGQMENSIVAHREIVDAFKNHDEELAERLVRAHVANASKALQRFIASSP